VPREGGKMNTPSHMTDAEINLLVDAQQLPAYREWLLIWAPTAQHIATVYSHTARGAVRKAPAPWSKYRGEIYAKEA